MAEETLQKVEDELITCSICLDTYTDPKLLQCFHVYCQGCLTRLVFRDQQRQLVLTCPNCRQVTPIPAGGVAGLQSAFPINHLMEIMEERKEKKLCCTEHNEEVKLYCETCGELICYKCVIKNGKHQASHDYDLLDEAFRKYKEEISSSLKEVEKKMITINQALEQLDISCGKITDQQATIEVNIHNTISRLQKVLDVRKTQLIGQLHQITQSKLKNLAAQKDQLETTQAQIRSGLDFMKKNMQADSHCDLLEMKVSFIKQVKELTAPLQPDFLKPCTEADLQYSGSADILADCRNYGRLSGLSFPDPSKCYATGYGLEIASVQEESISILHVVNYKNEPCIQPISSFECKLISEIAGTRVLGKIEREQSKYKISYQPTIKGRHHLHIKVEGQHIRGSPFSVAVMKSSIQKIGTSVQHITKVGGPHSVALDHEQKVVVSSVRDHRIHVFNTIEKTQTSVCSRRQLYFPMGIAVDSKGEILVVDSGHHHVLKFAAEGQLLIATNTKGKKQFNNPYGIAFNTNNNKVYVTDTYNHRVQVLNSDLAFLDSFGSHGSGKGQFTYPQSITCDNAGKVYVTDDHVQVFTAEGKFLKMIGGYGRGEGELNSPSDIAVDDNGLVYISETNNHRVSVFTPEGQFVRAFGENGHEPGQFIHPRGLAVDSNGVIYVCDMDNNRVQTFTQCN